MTMYRSVRNMAVPFLNLLVAVQMSHFRDREEPVRSLVVTLRLRVQGTLGSCPARWLHRVARIVT